MLLFVISQLSCIIIPCFSCQEWKPAVSQQWWWLSRHHWWLVLSEPLYTTDWIVFEILRWRHLLQLESAGRREARLCLEETQRSPVSRTPAVGGIPEGNAGTFLEANFLHVRVCECTAIDNLVWWSTSIIKVYKYSLNVCTNICPLILLCSVVQLLPGRKKLLSGWCGHLSLHCLCLPFWVGASNSRSMTDIGVVWLLSQRLNCSLTQMSTSFTFSACVWSVTQSWQLITTAWRKGPASKPAGLHTGWRHRGQIFSKTFETPWY